MDTARHKKHRLKFLGLIVIIVIIWLVGRYLSIDIKAIVSYLAGFPRAYSGLLYILLYVVITFFIFFSKDIFWIAGAVIFGPSLSAFLVWSAECINACILFYIARRLGRGFIEHYLKEKYSSFDERLGGLSFGWFFIFRAAPLIPYRFQDLSAGLTCVYFKRYFAAVILGSPLKIFWIQYILAGVGETILKNPAALVQYFLSNKTLLMFSLIYFILVIAVAVKLKLRIKY